MLKMGGEVSRTTILVAWGLTVLILPPYRWLIKTLLARVGIWRRKVLVLGAARTGKMVIEAIKREQFLGYEVAGALDDDPKKHPHEIGGVKVLGTFGEADKVMAQTGARNLIVAAPGIPGRKLVDLVNRLQQKAESILVVPDLFGIPLTGLTIEHFFDEQTLFLRVQNNLASKLNRLIKWAFDISVGSIILLLILPIITILALLIKLDSPGPAFFSHRRIGRHGKEFSCYKFRTMHVNSQ